MDRETPTFNLKAVVQETGIKPDTLRAWERRYGLPDPERSTGGHRLYSQRDIEILRWLMARQDEGLTISRAVDLWRSIEDEGQDPLRAPEYATNQAKALSIQGDEVQTFRKHWIDACLNFDEQTAERVLAQAFAIYPVETVCIDVLQNSLQEIGEGWYKGKVSVQQEHFISALSMRRVDAMLGVSSLPTRPGRILLACPPGEEHVFGQALLQLLLRRRGWETLYLGANVPMERLETTVGIVRPHLVVLCAQRLVTTANLLEMARMLQGKGIAVAYAGLVFNELPELQERIPGHFLGTSITQALEQLEDLVPNPPAAVMPPPVEERYQVALQEFQAYQAAIHSYVMQQLKATRYSLSELWVSNLDLAQSIIAALKLGNLNLVNEDLKWMRGLLANHKSNGIVMLTYLDIYIQAAQKYLRQENSPILEWLTVTRMDLADSVRLNGQSNGHHS